LREWGRKGKKGKRGGEKGKGLLRELASVSLLGSTCEIKDREKKEKEKKRKEKKGGSD